MRDDLDTRTTTGTRGGMGMGTIAAIVVAVLIIGALFFWPRDSNRSASSNVPRTTVGQTSTGPAPAAPASTPSGPSQPK
jgi:hypothetical protein